MAQLGGLCCLIGLMTQQGSFDVIRGPFVITKKGFGGPIKCPYEYDLTRANTSMSIFVWVC